MTNRNDYHNLHCISTVILSQVKLFQDQHYIHDPTWGHPYYLDCATITFPIPIVFLKKS